jgi:hypothetical protein
MVIPFVHQRIGPRTHRVAEEPAVAEPLTR